MGIGWAMILSYTFVMISTFMMAYQTSDKEIIVTIDDYGEANIELWVILLTLPCVLFVLYDNLKKGALLEKK